MAGHAVSPHGPGQGCWHGLPNVMLAEVYDACGVILHLEIPFYPADWNLHRDAERYLDGVMRHAIEISGRHSRATSRFFASAAATPMGRSWSNGHGSSTRGAPLG